MPDPGLLLPERAMVFIDAMNLYESLGAETINTNVEYYKFACKLVGAQRRLIRCHVYTGAYDQAREPVRHAGQVRYFNKVQAMPFVTLKMRRLVLRGGTYIQKGVALSGWAGNVSQLAGKQIKILAYDLNATGLANLNAAKNGQNWTFTNVTWPEFQTSTTRTRPRLPRTGKPDDYQPERLRQLGPQELHQRAVRLQGRCHDRSGFEGQAITIVKEK